MYPSPGADDPVVEPKPRGDDSDLTQRSLEWRIQQQKILADLGVTALQGASFDELLNETARLTAEGLRVEFCKVLEYVAEENRLLVRAGVGWEPGIVGVAYIGADLGSPAGYALRTGRPVISNQLDIEERFRTPEILWQHGVRRAMNVILQGDGKPFGVLEVDSQSEEAFEEHDLTFLQGAANLLGMAIEREDRQRKLKAALERQQLLLKEMNHRVKNSLTIVAGMLRLQATDFEDDDLTRALDEGAQRVAAVARAHEQLQYSPDVQRIDVGNYIAAVCKDLGLSIPQCKIEIEAEHGINISTDRAISSALVVNELVTNAAKHACSGQSEGRLLVVLAQAGTDDFSISVRDEGAGLPTAFDPRKAKGLGMRIINSFLQQLDASISVRRHNPGTEFVVTIPREPPR